jgi:hypothetical protein
VKVAEYVWPGLRTMLEEVEQPAPSKDMLPTATSTLPGFPTVTLTRKTPGDIESILASTMEMEGFMDWDWTYVPPNMKTTARRAIEISVMRATDTA